MRPSVQTKTETNIKQNTNFILSIFLCFLLFYFFLVNFTSFIPIPLISLSLAFSLCPCTLHTQTKFKSKTKTKKKHTKYKTNEKILAWKLSCGTVSHTMCPLVHPSLLVGVHCHEPLVWFETSGFFHVLDTGPSLAPLVYLIVSCLVS